MAVLTMPQIDLKWPLSQSHRELLNEERKRVRLEIYRLHVLEQRLVSLLCEEGESEEVVKIEVHG